ncbi:MAG: hypothetical protein J0H85_09060 [Sediminibacterium magnilacihabitans]|jgi:hypothetical protein|nr:hypothetical protein [Sediminibacterium magnilacihabitans]PQV60409.1 hypothetical protein CLV53_10892 [Sediminibacterium magnilacihabitans]
MSEKNIEQLATRLESLGCEPSIRSRLAAYACFSPAQFEIRHAMSIADVPCEFWIHCTKGDRGLYDCIYYTAVLKQKPSVPAGMEVLDEAMGTINWERLWMAREAGLNGVDINATRAGELFQQIIEIDTDGVFRFRHWAGTALEVMIPQLAALKSQYELAQRFYLMVDQAPIRFDEAHRFLQSRWMEKRINAERKLLIKSDRGVPTDTGAKGGKLLTKRTKANRKPGLFKQ